jgi:site-specific DNA-methyltransferase (adenine-specific)
MARLAEIDPLSIDVGDRFRKDYGDAEMAELRESIAKFGVLQPITVDESMTLLAGGRRLRAAIGLCLETIPALIRPVGGEVDLREIELAENVYRKDLTWMERGALEAKIHSLKGSSQRATAELIGESVGALNRRLQLQKASIVIPQLSDCKTEDDAWKMLKKFQERIIVKELLARAEKQPETNRAWSFADNHYVISDVFKGLAGLNPGIFGFAEVDPPYGIDLTEQKRTSTEVNIISSYNEIPDESYYDFSTRLAKAVYKALRPDSFCIWWFGFTQHEIVLESIQEAGFAVNPVPAIWYKTTAQGQTNNPSSHLAGVYEPFFVCRKGNPSLVKQGRGNVFAFDPVASAKKYHPTERPIPLIAEILNTFVWPRTNIIVPFLGSGATLRAAYDVGLSGMGFDSNSEYKARFLLHVMDDFKAAKGDV